MQPTMFPISQEDFEGAAFRIAELMEQRADALEEFDLAKKDHKDRLQAIDREMSECKRQIRLMREQRKGHAQRDSSIDRVTLSGGGHESTMTGLEFKETVEHTTRGR